MVKSKILKWFWIIYENIYSRKCLQPTRWEFLVVIRRPTLYSRISRNIEGRSQTPNFRQGMDLRMSHGQNQVQNAFGKSHGTFEDFLFNSDIVKIVDAQICDRNDF